jgi:hypothetical protein
VVPLELILAQTDEVAIAVWQVSAYPSGFAFEVLALMAPHTVEQERFDALMFRGPMIGPHAQAGPLRLGVQFADGSKATNESRPHPAGTTTVTRVGGGGDAPRGPIMDFAGGGGGGHGRWHHNYWVWPLPPPGPLAFVCEWPGLDIPVTRQEIDAQLILDAAARAQVIFSEDELPDPPVGTGP